MYHLATFENVVKHILEMWLNVSAFLYSIVTPETSTQSPSLSTLLVLKGQDHGLLFHSLSLYWCYRLCSLFIITFDLFVNKFPKLIDQKKNYDVKKSLQGELTKKVHALNPASRRRTTFHLVV